MRVFTPRFVLLEHNWNGVHWDFMLEAGEALRTWAIDAPIVAGRDLPARALGNHRKSYLDYEGEISGNRGKVRRLDAGTYRVLVWSDRHVRVEVTGSQLVGEVDLRSTGADSGESGSWVFRAGNFD
jgi:DNA polymerase ligase (LigD)-like protein